MAAFLGPTVQKIKARGSSTKILCETCSAALQIAAAEADDRQMQLDLRGAHNKPQREDAKTEVVNNPPACLTGFSQRSEFDFTSELGHVVPMSTDNDDTEQRWRQEFRRRVREGRGQRTQEDMAELLGVSPSAYAKYESARASIMPTRLLPRFAKICAMSLEYLITGERPQTQRNSEIARAMKPPVKGRKRTG